MTRTPLATVFMLGLSAAYSAHLSVILPQLTVNPDPDPSHSHSHSHSHSLTPNPSHSCSPTPNPTPTPKQVLLPPVIIASYVGVWVSQLLSEDTFFPYKAK